MKNFKTLIAASIISAAAFGTTTVAAETQPNFLNGTGAVQMSDTETKKIRGEGITSVQDLYSDPRLKSKFDLVLRPNGYSPNSKWSEKQILRLTEIGKLLNSNKQLKSGFTNGRINRAIGRIAVHLDNGEFRNARNKIERLINSTGIVVN